jgi:hypothetical protein
VVTLDTFAGIVVFVIFPAVACVPIAAVGTILNVEVPETEVVTNQFWLIDGAAFAPLIFI